MKTTARVSMFLLAVVAIAVVAAPALADPLPGQWPKFVQAPMIETWIPRSDPPDPYAQVYFGHDEESTARVVGDIEYHGRFMADDFADKVDNDVMHVTWWGSYMGPVGVDPGRVQSFLISFETDIPAVMNPDGTITPSRPGDPILSQIVRLSPLGPPAPGTFTEEPVVYTTPNPPPEPVYKYNAELLRPFDQKADTVYWLKIVALVGEDQQNLTWGWHNRDYTIKNELASSMVPPPGGELLVGEIPSLAGADPTPIYHFQDDAVTGQVGILWNEFEPEPHILYQEILGPTNYQDGVDGPGPMPEFPEFRGIGRYSKDLAFELYAVPEPSTLVLLALGLACLAGGRWRK